MLVKLDIACGTGELLKYYTNKGFKANGFDISNEMVNISKRKVPNAKIIKMSLYDIDKLEENCDGISATFALVHIPKEKINEFIEKINIDLNEMTEDEKYIYYTLIKKEKRSFSLDIWKKIVIDEYNKFF